MSRTHQSPSPSSDAPSPLQASSVVRCDTISILKCNNKVLKILRYESPLINIVLDVSESNNQFTLSLLLGHSMGVL